MEHPFLSSAKIVEECSLEEIQEKISELTKKLQTATIGGNPMVIHQLQMALNTYNQAIQEKYRRMSNPNDKNYDDLIDIK